MKKLWNYLRSMRFGILLLGLIGVFSFVGSIVPQNRAPGWYAETYPGFYAPILFLQLHRIYQSWYFLLLLALLCLNLTLCSLLRVRSIPGRDSLCRAAAAVKDRVFLRPEGLARLDAFLRARGFRAREIGDCRVYERHLPGRYGSFLTHLSILLVVVFGAAALYLPQVIDRDCMPGETLTLSDGTSLTVDAFSVDRTEGRIDYRSDVRLTLPDGRESGPRSVRVNHPLRFGPYKIYQQSYGTAGAIIVTNRENGGSDRFLLTDPSFLSLDRQDGLWFLSLYPDSVANPAGDPMPLNTAASDEPRPLYYVQISEAGENSQRFFRPGDEVSVGQLSFVFEEPAVYPGLRIKHTPALVSAALIAAFALMILALALTFFLPAELVKTDAQGCAVYGAKSEGLRLELRALLQHDILEEEEDTP